MQPKISVIIPTFNRARLVTETVESVLAQTFDEFEVIVVDDGSMDGTREHLSRFGELQNFRYQYQDNQGRSAARNFGMAVANGEFLMFLDSDDLLCPNALELLYDASRKYADSGVVAGRRIFVDQTGSDFQGVDPMTYDGEILSRQINFEKIRDLFICMGSYIVRRDIAVKLNGFDRQLEPAEDYDFFVRYCEVTPVTLLRENVVRIRQHEGNTSDKRLREASTLISSRQIAEIASKPKRDRSKMDLMMNAGWHMRLADDLYSLGDNRNALATYSRALRLYPRFLTGSYRNHIVKQLFACLLPKSLKRIVRSGIRDHSRVGT